MLKKIVQWLSKPVSKHFFLYVFILNLLSNYVDLHYDQSTFAYCCIFFLSALIAYIESAIFVILKISWLKKTYAIIVIAFHNILVICEYYLLLQFQMILNQDAIDILAETNPVEIENFIHTYFSPWLILSCVVLVILLNGAIYGIIRIVFYQKYQWIHLVFAFLGFCVLCLCGYNFIKFHNGMAIPQYTTLTRAGYAMYVMKGRELQIRQLEILCKNLEAKQTTEKPPTIIVVIGESASVYHSSLYGYEKPTNPLLSKYKADGSLFLFDNVVSLYDGTHGSMVADFSLDSLGVDYTNQPLFPACFKAVNYQTYMYDNQYFVGNGITFLTDQALSETMFDFRNTERYQYDEKMVDDIHVTDSVSLYVIHLWGQHYNYSQRFPKEFAKFKPEDYQKDLPIEQRQAMADYDNATLYNDYVLDKIIKKFQNQYCCLFYFSDHGEEVYELRDYMGHGNAAHSPNLNYQIRVPLMVWTSPSYFVENEELVAKMKEAEHYPICTDDIGHSIIDVAHITTKKFAPTRSFVNKQFNKNRHRIVLNSIDYDKEWVNKK